jgi:hypothetical protein
MPVTFLTPLAALAALAALLPLAALLLAERRARRVRAVLRLPPPGRGRAAGTAALVAFAFALLGVAAAQPVVRVERAAPIRLDAEAFVVADISRSMLAASSPSSPTRFERATAAGRSLAAGLQDVPVGVASLTDRLLPHVFPTGNASVVGAVLTRVLAIERPPPSEPTPDRATAFSALAALAEANVYGAGSSKRLAYLLTDGESRPFAVTELARELAAGGVGLVIVRFWREDERVWGSGGEPERYRPDPESGRALVELAAATAAGRVFGEEDLAGAAAAGRAFLGPGPTAPAAVRERDVPLAGYLALAAAAPLGLLALGTGRPRLPRPGRGRREEVPQT